MNPAEFLTISSAVVPDRHALVTADGKTRVTYAELASRVNRLSNALMALGVGAETRIAVMETSSPACVEVYYACAKLGACYVPLNFRAKAEELTYMLNASESSVVFVGERYVPLFDSIRSDLTSVQSVVTFGGALESATSYDELIASGEDEEIFLDVDESTPTALLFTSGTTALPKGVELTFLNLSLYVLNTMSPADLDTEPDRTLLSVGIFHVAGLTAILSAIWGGRTLVLLPAFDPEGWLETVQRERITHAFVVPTMLKRIMDHPRFAEFDLSSLELITYGAAPMPYETVCRAIEVFTCGLMNAYGQTESTSSLTFLGPDDHRLNGSDEENALKLHRLRSVGRAMPDVTLAILDAQGNQLDTGAEGEICVQSARVMKEYLKQQDATAAAVVDGWLHTGDVGFLDEDGYLFITGRVKDLIIRGGENIAPGEIEAILENHELVEESAVIGVPDAEWGEVVKALVVLRGGYNPETIRDELKAHCKERLASYKTPAYIGIVPELPRNPMGKVLKTDLRRDYGDSRDE